MDHQTHRVLWIKLLIQFSREIWICQLYIHNAFMRQVLNGRAEAKMEATTLYASVVSTFIYLESSHSISYQMPYLHLTWAELNPERLKAVQYLSEQPKMVCPGSNQGQKAIRIFFLRSEQRDHQSLNGSGWDSQVNMITGALSLHLLWSKWQRCPEWLLGRF